MKYARIVTVHQAFKAKFGETSPTGKQIWTWYQKFKDEGCLCWAKGDCLAIIKIRREGQASGRKTLARF